MAVDWVFLQESLKDAGEALDNDTEIKEAELVVYELIAVLNILNQQKGRTVIERGILKATCLINIKNLVAMVLDKLSQHAIDVPDNEVSQLYLDFEGIHDVIEETITTVFNNNATMITSAISEVRALLKSRDSEEAVEVAKNNLPE